VAEKSIVCLSSLDADLPLKLSAHIREHVIDDALQGFKQLAALLATAFFVKPEVLEPEWAVFWIVINPITRNFDSSGEFVLFLFVL